MVIAADGGCRGILGPMVLGSAMHRIASRLPGRVRDRLQHIANTSPRGRAILARLTEPMRHGEHRIAAGPAAGMLMDVAGSRPSYLLGTAEAIAVQFLVDNVKAGDTVFDLGANVGYFTLIAAALVGSSGKVVAYEPVPANSAALRRNVLMNRLEHVEVVEAAVSGTAGTAEIAFDSSDQTASLVAARGGGAVTVATVRLDDEVQRVGAPNVIKSDIEGAEYDAFECADSALAGLPAILCEVHRFAEGDHERIVETFRRRGYETAWLDKGGWTSHLVARASASAELIA